MKSWIAALLMSAALPAVAQAEDFPAERVMTMASGDWNNDGAPDLVLVATPGDDDGEDNGLYVYLAKPEESRLTLALALANFAWGDLSDYGREPELAALANGSFTLTTKNDSGPDLWRQSLTVAYRNFDFIVAGYTFFSYFTGAAPPEDGAENRARDCDLNVLTGRGKSGERILAGQPQFVLLKNWKDEMASNLCGLDD